MRRLVLPAIVAAIVLVSVGARAAPSRLEPPWVTSRWAGYVARTSNGSFEAVRGTWVQPRITCNRPGSSAAIWIGLGGATGESRALEQVGTSADCSERGESFYSAWYQLFPASPVELPVTIRPGDTVAANAAVAGNVVALALRNVSSGASFSTELWMRSPETDSAEWILEAPSACFTICVQLPLADLGRVAFTGASTTVATHTGTIGDRAWSARKLDIASSRRGRVAVSTPLSGYGSSFAVIWPKVKR
jgi:Peptidase A4 family